MEKNYTKRMGISLPIEEAKKYDTLIAESEYYDRLQYVYKIRLNSFYGALLNEFFKFYDLRLGSSTTATGRMIMKHQASEVNRLLNDEYDYTGDALVAGDSVGAKSILTLFDGVETTIENMFVKVDKRLDNGKEYYYPKNCKTLTYDEKINKSCFRDVKYVMRHKVNKQMYRVWLTNSSYVDVTEDHSLIGYKNTQKKRKNESHLYEIIPDDLGKTIKSVVFLKSIPRTNIKSRNYSKEVYELLGYVIGDGNIEARSVALSVGKQDIEEVSKKLLNPLIEQGLSTSFSIRTNGHDVRIYGKEINDIIKSLYVHGIKSFPAWIFNEIEENICSFLRGYFSADGSICGRSTIKLTSVNENFIVGAQKLLFYCGISSNYFTENTENNYLGKKTGTFSKNLIIKNKIIFKDKIGFILERKYNKIPESGNQEKYLDKFDFQISNILKVEKIEYNDYVYDIEVDDTHVFFANNILVHNTDSSYFKTYARNKKEAIKIADAVGRKVNKTYKKFMSETFLLPDKYNDKMNCAREIVASKAIYIKKKMYLGYIINSEGKDCSYLKMMGIAFKRTTIPKEISKTLSKLIERFMSGEDWEPIKKEISQYKEHLSHPDNFFTIGKPLGVKNIEEYTKKYEESELCKDYDNYENHQKYKKINLPGHVAASIFYNLMRDKYNDKASLKISSGMKIRVFYLTKTFGRFKSIAIPTDIDVIPQWFKDDFGPLIDVDKQLEVLVDKPLESILTPAKLTVPSKLKLLSVDDDMFEF